MREYHDIKVIWNISPTSTCASPIYTLYIDREQPKWVISISRPKAECNDLVFEYSCYGSNGENEPVVHKIYAKEIRYIYGNDIKRYRAESGKVIEV